MSSFANTIAPSSTVWDILPSTSTTLLVVIICLIFKIRRQNESKKAEFVEKLHNNRLHMMPSPPRLPIIGHLHLMRDYQDNPWEGFNSIRKQYGDIVSLRMGIHPMILVSNINVMREVLIEKGEIFADRPSFPRHDIVFGGDKEHSLALCNWSNTHKARRKFCKRGVVPNKLSARNQLLERIVSEYVVKFTENVINDKQQVPSQLAPNSACFEMTKRDILFLTGDIFMKFLCNETRQHDDKSYDKFNWGCDFIFWDINQCYLLDFLPYLTSFGFGHQYLKQVKEVTDYCRYFIDDNIFEPRYASHLMESKANETINSESDDHDYLDSIIIEQIAGVTSMSLDDYKVGFADLLAGHGAVANILMKLLGHLALNPAAQEMLYEEARQEDLSNLDHRPNLPVAEAALREALRLASSPIVPHVAREDTSLSEYYVPKGSAVLFNCYNVNLSDELWDRPREFDPTRFLKSSINDDGQRIYKLSIPKYFTPFSIGLRTCLGSRMVEAISIVAAANICGKFRIKTDNEVLTRKLLEPKGTVALDPEAECFNLHLYPR